jgi:hypothetical protein
MPTRYKTNNKIEDDENTSAKNLAEPYNDNEEEEEEDEADDAQRSFTESLEFPRTTLMARKSTSPIKFFLKKRLKSESSSNEQTCVSSSAVNPPSLNKRKSSHSFKVPPQESEEAISLVKTESQSNRTSTLNKNNKNSISSSSLSTIDTEDNESVATTSRFQNGKKPKIENINLSEEISTLNLIESIRYNDFDLNFNLSNITNKQVKNKFIEDYQSRFFVLGLPFKRYRKKCLVLLYGKKSNSF